MKLERDSSLEYYFKQNIQAKEVCCELKIKVIFCPVSLDFHDVFNRFHCNLARSVPYSFVDNWSR